MKLQPHRLLAGLTSIGAAVLVLAACSHGPEKAAENTGAGWAPAQVVNLAPGAQQVRQSTYTPGEVGAHEWKVCAVVPSVNPLLPTPSKSAAITYGITDQAARQHVSLKVYGGATNKAQHDRLVACEKSSDALIVEWVDATQAGFADVATPPGSASTSSPGLANLVVVGAPGYSYAATHSTNLVAEPAGQQAVMAAQWALGASGGTSGTVVVLPGPATDAAGNDTGARATTNLVLATLKGTSLKVVGVSYGPDNLTAQRALLIKAMTAHPGLTYVLGDATAAQAAGSLFEIMNTNRRPQVVAMGFGPAIEKLIRSGAIAAGMSGSPVTQGRIALDLAVVLAKRAGGLVAYGPTLIAPVPLPVDPTNVAAFPESSWLAPASTPK
jgi:protein TorT